MSKWCGKIGFAEHDEEIEPGYYEDTIVEHLYQGDVLSTNWKRYVSTERVGDDIKLKKLEDMLYGTEQAESKLPLPAEVITLMKDAAA